MATVIYCDCCGNAIKQSHIGRQISIPAHITDETKKYSDNYGNAVSGRFENFDMCLACSNTVFSAAFNKIKELSKSNPRMDGKPKLDGKTNNRR